MTSDTTVPATPAERSDVQQQDADRLAQPGAGTPPTVGNSSAGLDGDTSAVVSGADADALTDLADASERIVGEAGAAAAVGAAATRQGATGTEIEVECPSCAMVLVGESPRPTAAWFCPRCDYPLFWATPPPVAEPASARARRRLPGTGGRTVLGSEPCWYCGEMNAPDIKSCFRCAADLPKPAPPVPTIAPRIESEPVLVSVPSPSVTWPYLSSGILAGLAIGASFVQWLSG